MLFRILNAGKSIDDVQPEFTYSQSGKKKKTKRQKKDKEQEMIWEMELLQMRMKIPWIAQNPSGHKFILYDGADV